VADPLVVLEIPATPAYVGVARSVVYAAAAIVPGIDDERLDDLRIAVSEACTNAVEAHQSVQTLDRVVLRCDLEPTQLLVRIEDSGDGFDPDAVPVRPAPGEPGHLDAERGWGIQLIRALVDRAEFSSSADGTAVTLTMQRNDD
jgi:serine/threonine-protein kinase RsbW